jgi:hypothetical protein
MNVIIAGSRDIEDYNALKQAIKDSGFKIKRVISGKARGADRLGERWAMENGIEIHGYRAKWEKWGNSAGFKRNQDMAMAADAAIVLWDGMSKGSNHMINIMKAMKKPVHVHIFKR